VLNRRDWLGLLLLAGVAFCAVPAWAQGEGKTLRQVLAAEQLPLDAEKLTNLDKTISSGAELNDASQFVIAYFLLDGTGRLNPPIYVDLFDRKSGQWRSGSIGEAAAKWEGGDVDCLGSVLSIAAYADYFALETHINPSAGCEIILSREMKVKTALYGWTLGHFGDGGIFYHRSQIHFATVHPAELAFYDPATGKDFILFPHKPFQEIRLEEIKELREFFAATLTLARRRTIRATRSLLTVRLKEKLSPVTAGMRRRSWFRTRRRVSDRTKRNRRVRRRSFTCTGM